jgi:DnaJ-class molecular chaperone
MKCPDCFGLGYVAEMRSMVFGRKIEPAPACKPCNGIGKLPVLRKCRSRASLSPPVERESRE